MDGTGCGKRLSNEVLCDMSSQSEDGDMYTMSDTLTAAEVTEKIDAGEMSIEDSNENTRQRKDEELCLYCDSEMYTTLRSNPSEPDPPVCKFHYVNIARSDEEGRRNLAGSELNTTWGEIRDKRDEVADQ